MSNCWNVKQYHKFQKERDAPFYDLLGLIQSHSEMRVVDLGCGAGNLTLALHKHLNAKETLGLDSSNAMLAEAYKISEQGLRFQKENVATFHPKDKFDLIFSNACLQWVPDHITLFKNLASYLSARGQMAFQVPANDDAPTHVIAREIAVESPFKEAGLVAIKFNLLTVEEYARLFYQLGFKHQIVRQQVYGHILDSTESVVEWVKGSLLTYYQSKLSAELFELFLERYRQRLFVRLGDQKPIFYPFKRLLLWAEK